MLTKQRNLLLPLILVALLISIGSFLYFFATNALMGYPDAQSRLLIARRVCDSSSPGFAQLGAVWLPLTHVLSLPFVCSDVWSPTLWGVGILVVLIGVVMFLTRRALMSRTSIVRTTLTVLSGVAGLLFAFALKSNVFYTTGIGMSVWSMLSYVLTGVLIFQFVIEITNGDQWSGIVAALIFLLNPNIIYLQATAMTELPLYFGVMLSMYTFRKLILEPSKLKWLFLTGAAAVIMTTARYEGWTILMAEGGIYALLLVYKRFSFTKIVGHLVYWGTLAGIGVIGWILWGTTLFSNPKEFINGTYSKSINWVSGTEAAVGSLPISVKTYGYGMLDTVGPIVVVAILALVVYLLVKRLSWESFAAMLPLVMIPFFIYMIYNGQRPMQAFEIEGTVYNARFALIIILSVAILIGFMVQKRLVLKGIAIVILLISTVMMMQSSVGVVTLTEAQNIMKSSSTSSQLEAADFVRNNYDGTSMLMEGYGNEQVQFVSGINLREIIYEGTYRLWEPNLKAPYANHIQWIIMRGTEGGNIASLQPDLVWKTVRTQQSFIDHYHMVFKNDTYEIYRLNVEITKEN